MLYLVGLAESGEARVQIAATGLLKRYYEHGDAFTSGVVTRLLDLLPSAQHWEATLHLLQLLPHLSIPISQAEALCDSLRDLTRSPNTFVRAWAYSGLHHLAELHPKYGADVSPLLERAGHEERTSVRARLRQLRPLAPEPTPFDFTRGRLVFSTRS